jgi:hypothetical protein
MLCSDKARLLNESGQAVNLGSVVLPKLHRDPFEFHCSAQHRRHKHC